MEYPLDHAAFRSRRLTIESAGWLHGPRLLVAGAPAKRSSGRYLVTSDAGVDVPIEVRPRWLDPVPKVRVGDAPFELVRALRWYEYLWISIPVVLILIGGALGALIGIAATSLSARLFRTDLNAVARYGFSGLISIAAMVMFAILATLLSLA
jgi:hypothetical protein